MKLSFKQSSGINSLNNASKYIDDITNRASDLTTYFKGLEDDIVTEIQHEFDYSNPNDWKDVSLAWLQYKKQNGYPENIGIYTGQLLTASTHDAIKTYAPTFMKWEIDNVYSIGFTKKRKIGISTSEFLRGLGRQIAKVIIGRATKINE